MEPRPRYRGGEAFVRGLVEAVPGAFEGKDLRAEYGYGLDYGSFEDNGLPSDGWLSTIALCDAVAWLGMNAIVADASTETSVLLPGGEALLRGLFDYIEQVLVEGGDDPYLHWIDSELFDGAPWTESVIELLGPHTVRALRAAQESRGRYGIRGVGRWD